MAKGKKSTKAKGAPAAPEQSSVLPEDAGVVEAVAEEAIAADASPEAEVLPEVEALPETGTPDEDTSEQDAKRALEEGDTPALEPAQDTGSMAPSHEDIAAVSHETPKRGSGVVPLVLGGVLAGAIGFAVAEYMVAPPVDSQMAARLGALESEVRDVSAREFATQDDIDATTAALADARAELETQLNDLRERMEALENRPVATLGSDDVAAAYEAEIAALRSRFDALAGDAEARLSQAEAAAEQTEEQAARAADLARAEAAVSRLLSALDAGTPFAGALGEITDLAGIDTDPALLDVAADGVTTLEGLRAEFPEAARNALTAARRASDEPQGIAGFLKTQLGVRSLEPKEGNDPDAVLSRAEAAVGEGRLEDAVAELGALSQAGLAPLETWMTNAQTRLNAVAAAETLAAQVSKN